MLSRENQVIATSILVGTVLIAAVVLTGLFDEWQAALSFILFGLFWYAISQLSLALTVDDVTVAHAPERGVGGVAAVRQCCLRICQPP